MRGEREKSIDEKVRKRGREPEAAVRRISLGDIIRDIGRGIFHFPDAQIFGHSVCVCVCIYRRFVIRGGRAQNIRCELYRCAGGEDARRRWGGYEKERG